MSESLSFHFGNSYSFYNNLPGILQSLAKGNGKHLNTKIITRNGASLQEHWKENTAINALKNKHWDFVVLQERSSLIREKRYQTQKYAHLFQTKIRLHASDNVHPNPKDTLLSAYVFYMTIFGNINVQVKKVDLRLELDPNEDIVFRKAAADVTRQIHSGTKKAD